jgi:hypothetical protein
MFLGFFYKLLLFSVYRQEGRFTALIKTMSQVMASGKASFPPIPVHSANKNQKRGRKWHIDFFPSIQRRAGPQR